jgi:uracil permease
MGQEKSDLVLDVDESPTSFWSYVVLALQHVLAMLVACITVPLVINKIYPDAHLPLSATLISSGIGTLAYILITKKKSPVYLSSSFAYIPPMISALTVGLIGGATGMNYFALILGMTFVALVYVIIALVVKFTGTDWLNKLLPPIVVGPVIMVIGLSLATSAVSNLTSSNATNSSYNLIAILIGLLSAIITALVAYYGNKNLKMIPFVIGMLSGYLLALIFTGCGYLFNNDYLKIIDFTPLINIFSPKTPEDYIYMFFNYKMFIPNSDESFIFLRFEEISKFDWGTIITVALLFIPVSFVTICEHIGDHLNLSNIIHHDIFKEVGMKRTLMGDGIGTGISGLLCGAANTTYGENVAVIGITKVASINVMILACVLAILSGFLTPLTTLLETIPSCVCGGVSLLLYGFIASSGTSMLISKSINLGETKNILIMSAILVSGIGGLTLKFGNVDSPFITITSIAVSMFLGSFMNLILREKKDNILDNSK